MAEEKYAYMINPDYDPPLLARLSGISKGEIFGYPGEWQDAPHLCAMVYGGGPFMDYDDITEEEAAEYETMAREHFARIIAEKEKAGGTS